MKRRRNDLCIGYRLPFLKVMPATSRFQPLVSGQNVWLDIQLDSHRPGKTDALAIYLTGSAGPKNLDPARAGQGMSLLGVMLPM